MRSSNSRSEASAVPPGARREGDSTLLSATAANLHPGTAHEYRVAGIRFPFREWGYFVVEKRHKAVTAKRSPTESGSKWSSRPSSTPRYANWSSNGLNDAISV